MRRNSSLMMQLLSDCASGSALNDNEKGEIEVGDEKFSAETIKYHLAQLEEAGFIKVDTNAKKDSMAHMRLKKAIELAQYHVTPKGHDRLEYAVGTIPISWH